MMRIGLPLILLLLLALAGCSSGEPADEAPLPTAAPTVALEQEAATADGDSPRVTPRAGSGLPPTWTPQPPPPTPEPFGTLAPAFRPAPGEGASEGEVYEVVAGDTLAEIAVHFDVELERLAEANGIENPDQIEVGMLLVIPR